MVFAHEWQQRTEEKFLPAGVRKGGTNLLSATSRVHKRDRRLDGLPCSKSISLVIRQRHDKWFKHFQNPTSYAAINGLAQSSTTGFASLSPIFRATYCCQQPNRRQRTWRSGFQYRRNEFRLLFIETELNGS